MAFITSTCRRSNLFSPLAIPEPPIWYVMAVIYPSRAKRWLSTSTDSAHPEFSDSDNAYEVLGVAETSSFKDIKVSFRKLAKETHPDLVSSSQADSKRFVEILAAYEILSDPTKRALYDQYLLTTRQIMHKHVGEDSSYYIYETHVATTKQMEVVEWLRWYRYAVKEILSERSLPAGTGYFDVLQREFYSAIHSAYFGPEVLSLDLLPDRFEAEERSVYETPEVLHLVSGRDLFGIVRIADDVLEISDVSYRKLTNANVDSDLCQPFDNSGCQTNVGDRDGAQLPRRNIEDSKYHGLDAYKDLELHVCGRLVAMATRVPPKDLTWELDKETSHDQIHVFLNSHDEMMHVNRHYSYRSTLNESISKILLGRITGLGTNPDESACDVYNSSGSKTHVILKHRTPLVKHMHWFQVGDKVSICECRCTRARLPPSKYWLFEPRCSTHDIGGWYVETYGRDRQNVPSQRYWDGFNSHQQFEKRLHPAVYLLGLAYRTLDLENARSTKRTVWGIANGKLSKIFSWCKKFV
ncbi:hypothetical protein RND81_02G134600 [Saponaria officinalis]|uniref:J domain-containing protein n=2 Tax=Saponaria officinalis TaxID=3572 RepID=A0AAW1MU84_SAPOF